MIAAQGETYVLKLFKRRANSFEWEQAPTAIFKGRPATSTERRDYRITQGVAGTEESVTVYCSNLPKEVSIDDKVRFLGKEWTVSSIGLYLNDSRVVNANVMRSMGSKCPKGITLR